MLCIGRCCLCCCICIIKYINRNGYIVIAITGKNFCYAAKDGFEIVWSDPLRFGVMAGVGRALSFVGNIFIGTLSTIIIYLIIEHTSFKASTSNPYLLMIACGLLSLLISMVFIFIFTAAMDTILICYILDEAQGKGEAAHAPPMIADLFEK